jgi:hypothetical protein
MVKSRRSQLWALALPMTKSFRCHAVGRMKPPLRAFSAQARFDDAAALDDLGQSHYLRPASLATPRQAREPPPSFQKSGCS